MKVAVVTRHAISNYGSILQTYATTQAFKKCNADAEIIDYIRDDEKPENLIDTYIKSSKVWNLCFLTRAIYKLLQSKNIFHMEKVFSQHRKEILNLTSHHYACDKDFVNYPIIADIYCTGSDQVWGKIGCSNYDKNYFLDFAPKNSKCIAYSASFGKEQLCPELKENLKSLVDKYQKIMVREISAKELLKKYSDVDSDIVLDPTLLLNQSEWIEFIHGENIPYKNYILLYQLHHNKKFDQYAKYLAKKMGLKLVRVSVSKHFRYKVGKFEYIPSPKKFLSLIYNSSFVLTDSFHGTVFSIIFNKQFIDILPDLTGTRIESLLQIFNIKDRIVKSYDDINVINNSIDYNNVNTILDTRSRVSLSLLREALKQ